MAGWVLWILATCAFAIGELITGRFLLAGFAIGSGAAAVADAVRISGLVSWIVFIAATLLALGIVRPIVRGRVGPGRVRAGAEGLVGREAIVLERIANHEGVGCVKIDGELWTARAFDDGRVIERGARVEVVQMRGATALVSD